MVQHGAGGLQTGLYEVIINMKYGEALSIKG